MPSPIILALESVCAERALEDPQTLILVVHASDLCGGWVPPASPTITLGGTTHGAKRGLGAMRPSRREGAARQDGLTSFLTGNGRSTELRP